MYGIVELSGSENVVYEYLVADILLNTSGIAQTVDGNRGLNLNNFAATATLTFAIPVYSFGGYFGAYTSGAATQISFTFLDDTDTPIGTADISYDRSDTADGLLEWHGWAFRTPVHKIVISGDYVTMDYLQINRPLLNVSGTAVLENIVPYAHAQEVTFDFRDIDTGEYLFTRTASIGPDGQFSLSEVSVGIYNVRVKSAKYLSNTVLVDTTNGDATDVIFLLRAGDANNDNIVDVEDLNQLIQAFDADPTSPNWNDGVADFNCDDIVAVDDLDLLIRNFDMEGNE
jgi:hypothetical protein